MFTKQQIVYCSSTCAVILANVISDLIIIINKSSISIPKVNVKSGAKVLAVLPLVHSMYGCERHPLKLTN